jgi:pyruvate kinase
MHISDGIMVARGDLGMEIPTEKVFLAQKYMIDKCNAFGKPVIVATQMLESMINNPRPTRAEASDVANAIIDGADCVMLSGESANGSFPVAAVRMMASICAEAESSINHKRLYEKIVGKSPTPILTADILAAACAQAALSFKIDLIIVLTVNGMMPQRIMKYRPKQNIFA